MTIIEKSPEKNLNSHYKCKHSLTNLEANRKPKYKREQKHKMLYLGLAREKLIHEGVSDPSKAIISFSAKYLEETFSLRRENQIQKKEIAHLKNENNRDGLTGVYNRRYLDKALANAIEHSIEPFSILIFDIDHFKNVNDTYGHTTGDAVLKQFAKALQCLVRPEDIVARFGGEEFCIILKETNGKDAMLVAERIRGAVEKHPFHLRSIKKDIQYTTSIGVSCVDFSQPDANRDATSLIKKADDALYQAKKSGRNKVVLAKS